jgi:hypothetical protein
VKYMLLYHVQESASPEPVRDSDAEARLAAWLEEMTGRGVLLDGGRLQHSRNGTTLRQRDDGGLLISDGPFAETKEQVGGYDVIECADLNEALEVAAGHPVFRYGAIEVRPLEPDHPAAG